MTDVGRTVRLSARPPPRPCHLSSFPFAARAQRRIAAMTDPFLASSDTLAVATREEHQQGEVGGVAEAAAAWRRSQSAAHDKHLPSAPPCPQRRSWQGDRVARRGQPPDRSSAAPSSTRYTSPITCPPPLGSLLGPEQFPPCLSAACCTSAQAARQRRRCPPCDRSGRARAQTRGVARSARSRA